MTSLLFLEDLFYYLFFCENFDKFMSVEKSDDFFLDAGESPLANAMMKNKKNNCFFACYRMYFWSKK